ncbi:DUF4198 domain-containing protein [Aquimarina sp. M1]
MKKHVFGILCILLLCSHDMYLKMDSYFITPNQDAVINLYNGTFDKSENIIDRNRMLDASLVGNGERIKVDEKQWIEKDSITKLYFKSGNEGTWIAGISTKSRNIEMDANDFNSYLEHDGVKDMLQQRTEDSTLNTNAIEKYSKHVKAIFQVGDKRTADWQTDLGYPIEFIPLSNPYNAHTGDTLRVKLLRDGQPLSNQLVYADYKPSKQGHSHGVEDHSHNHTEQNHTHKNYDNNHTHEEENHSHSDEQGREGHTHEHSLETDSHVHSDEEKNVSHTHTTGQELRTNDEGIISVNLSNDGIWYMRTIHLVTTEEEGLTHESNWATLTFEVSHAHDHADTDHKHKEGFPTYIFWLLSIVILGGLFFWYNKRKKSSL